MTKVAYTSRTGHKLFKPRVSLRSLERKIYGDISAGWCLACGTETDGVEPDARKYTCPSCHAPKVYGLEELMMRGLVEIH